MIQIEDWVTDPHDLNMRDLFQKVSQTQKENRKVAFIQGIAEVDPYGVAVVWYTSGINPQTPEGLERENEEVKQAFLKAWNGQEG